MEADSGRLDALETVQLGAGLRPMEGTAHGEGGSVSIRTLMMEFLAYANSASITGTFGALINNQQFEFLNQNGVVLKEKVASSWLLPWYKEGDSGSRAWHDLSAEQYTVATWMADESAPQRARAEKMQGHPYPSLALRDLSTRETLLIDGCHRACGAMLRGEKAEAIVYETCLAPVLCAADFFRVSMKERSEVKR